MKKIEELHILTSDHDFNSSRDIIEESMQSLIGNVKQLELEFKGILFATNANGVLIARHNIRIEDTDSEVGLFEIDSSWLNSNRGDNAVQSTLRSLKYEAVSAAEHSYLDLQSYHTYAIPVFVDSDQLLAVLCLAVPADDAISNPKLVLQSLFLAFQSSIALTLERKANQRLTTSQAQSTNESIKTDTLLQVAKKLHSKIDVEDVLIEMIDNIKALYPSVEIDLYMSQDNHSSRLQVKPLLFDDPDNELCARAFMEGSIVAETNISGQNCVVVPLSGKQGVYGVMQLIFQQIEYDEEDLDFISMLADSAGTAFENAKLYEQSNLLISELRLINEITRRLNQSLKLYDIFNYASNELLNIFNANFSCILQLDSKNKKMIVQASNLPSFSNEVFDLEYGYAGVVYKTKEPLIISDYSQNARVQSMLMENTNSRSLIAAPIIVNSDVLGVILATHREPNFFSYENYKLLQVISSHIGLAITNASLHAEVRRMVITDNLTGLYSRGYLDEQINSMQKKDSCGSLILADIDYFKKINDTYGHQVGDKILEQVSKIITSSIRDSDIAARWGGEELAIYLPNSRMEKALRVAERIRSCVYDETNPHVTISCGIAEWNWEDEKVSVESLFYQADMALYDAKNSGRNQIKTG